MTRVHELERELGWQWEPEAASWDQGLEHLRQYVEDYGTAVMHGGTEHKSGFPVAAWVDSQRDLRHRRRLTKSRLDRLEAIQGWEWERVEAGSDRWEWEVGLAALKQFVLHLSSQSRARGLRNSLCEP
jgi:hypothetical protein